MSVSPPQQGDSDESKIANRSADEGATLLAAANVEKQEVRRKSGSRAFSKGCGLRPTGAQVNAAAGVKFLDTGSGLLDSAGRCGSLRTAQLSLFMLGLTLPSGFSASSFRESRRTLQHILRKVRRGFFCDVALHPQTSNLCTQAGQLHLLGRHLRARLGHRA